MFIQRSFVQIVSVSTTCRLNFARHILTTQTKSSSKKINMDGVLERSSVSIKTATQTPDNIVRYNNILKSEQDNREYRGLMLQNDMKVLLVSDPTTDISAASLSVEVGHMSDPKELPGLAHFCEHMLFLGTEKYQNENEYATYLSQNGGYSNASTYPTMTKFYFNCDPEKFDGALDRFAQFFISPLFTESATERELNAVDSEHEKNLLTDSWRLSQLNKSLGDENHPYSYFGTGNKETLKIIPEQKNINVRDELIKFHNKWYSANIMSLAVFGKESLDELEEMVTSKFAVVKNKNVELPKWSAQPYKSDEYGIKVYAVPIKDLRNLGISFTTKEMSEYYKSSPEHYLSHLLGHEGPGSLLSELRRRGWCSQLMSSHSNTSRAFGSFSLSVDLTEDGLEHIDEIIELIFQYIKMLQKSGPSERIFNEIRQLHNIQFKFKDKEDPVSFVTNVVHSMQLYPIEEALIGPHLLCEWRPDLITELLNEFTPEKCRVICVGKKFESIANQTEKWYKTKYQKEKIPEKTLTQWQNCAVNNNLNLPEPNLFIPTNFDLLAEDKDITKHPIIIYDSPILRVWHKQDNEYKKPKTCMNFDLSNPIVYSDPLNCNLSYMLLNLFKDNLKEYIYDAELGGLHLIASNTISGINITISGYNDKQKILLEKVFDTLFNIDIDPKRFEILKETYYRKLKNFTAEQPYQHAIYYLTLILTENAWSYYDLLEAMKLVTVDSLQHFMKDFFSRLHAECLIYGNVNKENATEISDFVKTKLEKTNSAILPLLSRQLLQKREYKLYDGESYLFESKTDYHKNSCVQLYLQCGAQTETSIVFIDLLSQVLTEPCFTELRTKEQLGYIVFCGSRKANGATGIRIIVQSNHDTNFVEERIENFLKSMLQQLEEMSEEQFESHKSGLATKKLEKPKKLLGMFSQYLNEITISQYHFDRSEAEVALLRKITKDELINYYKKFISSDAPARHVLSIHIISSGNTLPDEVSKTSENKNSTMVKDEQQNNECIDEGSVLKKHVKIVDLSAFKSSKELYPIPRPYLDISPKGAKSKL